MQDYVQKCKRTESLISEIEINPRILHAILGINTEAVELLVNAENKNELVNYAEELGDLNWYLAVLCDSLNINFNELLNKSKSYTLDELERLMDSENVTSSQTVSLKYYIPDNIIIKKLIITSSDLLDLIKKQIFYKKAYTKEYIIGKLEDIFRLNIHLCSNLGLSIDNILKTNIAKLTARYPDKFCEDKAINRDLGAELETLKV